jgi:pectinesterase
MKKYISLLLAFTFLFVCSNAQQYPSELTVAKDGSGDYKTIGEAINAFRAYSPVALKLHIKNGTYDEKLVLPHWLTNITIDGESREHTIITHNDFSGKPLPGGLDSATGHLTLTLY